MSSNATNLAIHKFAEGAHFPYSP